MKWQYIVIILVLCNFAWYIIKLRKKKGLILDLWVLQNITSWLWYFIIYSFADSTMNERAVGDALWNIHKGLEEAFIVVLVGYITLWAGKYVCDYRIQQTSKAILFGLSKKLFIVFATSKTRNIYILFHLPFIVLMIYNGLMNLGHDFREIIGTDAVMRPIMNLVMIGCPVIISIYFCLYLQKRRKSYLYIAIVLSLFVIVLSSRAVLFSSIVTAFTFYAINRGRKMSITKVAIVGSLVVIGVFSLSFFRTGNISNMDSNALLDNIMYGNSFSDIRDFAWVLGCWNHDLLFGKTYLAGLFSFIPSAISDFRQHWGLGRFTLMTVGIFSEDSFHGGLRCTIFGEAYFNFGFIGVIIIAFINGYYLEKINRNVIGFCIRGKYLEAYAVSLLGTLLGLLTISAGAFNIYCIFIPVLLLYKMIPRKIRVSREKATYIY